MRAPGRSAPASPWSTRRAIVAHVALIVWVPGCAVAAWWQVGIALGGDSLGWVYSVMWPLFAVFGMVFWWFLVHDDPESLGRRGLERARDSGATSQPGPTGTGPAPKQAEDEDRIARAEAEDPELASYNAYLASLRESPKTWRRP